MAQRLEESASQSVPKVSPVPDSQEALTTAPGDAQGSLRANERGSYRFPAEPLRLQLLGGVRAGPGLIRRVHHRVEQLSSPEGPGYRTGSVIPTGTSSHESESQDGLIEDVSELCIALIEWQAGKDFGTASNRAKQGLFSYLAKNRITDVDYVKTKLRAVRTEVSDQLRPESPEQAVVDRCESLARFLTTWMGGCPHDFQRVPADEGINILACHCGASYVLYPGNETWFAAG